MLHNLQITRPLAFIDIETTGLNAQIDRIIEISIIKYFPDNNEEVYVQRFNPEMKISPAASKIHGLTNEDLLAEPLFCSEALKIESLLADCDLSGFGIIRFDLPCLTAEFERCNVVFSMTGRYVIDSQVIFHMREPRNLTAAYQKYCGRVLINAHCAEDDTRAAAEVLDNQVNTYEDLPKTIPELAAYFDFPELKSVDPEGMFVWRKNEIVSNFGKYSGWTLQDILSSDKDYLEWILRSEFSEEVKNIVHEALNANSIDNSND